MIKMTSLLKKETLKLIMLAVFAFGMHLNGAGQSVTAPADSILIAKNFPLLSRLNHSKKLFLLLKRDKIFTQIKENQNKRTAQALQQCGTVSCYADSLKLNSAEIKLLGDELTGALYGKHKKIFRETVTSLRKSGAYALYEAAADTAFLRSAWNNCAKGINQIIDVYIKGKLPRYPKIDSISFAPEDAGFRTLVRASIQDLITKKDGHMLFYTLPLNAAVMALKINDRDEAARYEPLKGGLNKGPVSALAGTKWSAYKYSVILTPGLGPETPGVSLDPGGMKRCDDAALRFRKGLAPFIVVSGGHVHPFKTKYNEAIEMKKYMVEQLHVPDSVVFIEPHARHTTTNLRNTCRMIYRFGLPADKPVLIVTDKSQSNYIVNQMDKTAMRDLGYLPYINLKKLTEFETEFYPAWNSLQADPIDPLDP